MPPSTAKQFSGIFICYRRNDASGHAGRLFDRLNAHFGDEQIFMDIDHVEPGENFVQLIERNVGSCEILLALIGQSWVTSRNESGRRLNSPEDFVRLEIAAALAGPVRVVPLLVQGARMPRPQDLTEDLLPLLELNAVELSDLRWKHDVDQLIQALEKILTRKREERLTATQREAEEAERQAREAEEAQSQVREEEEAERSRLEEEWVERNLAVEPKEKKQLKKSRRALVMAVVALLVAGAALAVATGVVLIVWSYRAPPGNYVYKQPDMTNHFGMEFILIPPGNFMMGTENGRGNEKPVHQVAISEAFYIGKYEVTQQEWQAVMGSNPSFHKGDRVPVDNVSWDDAIAFISRLNLQNDGHTYALPSEAEWEYASRAGITGDDVGNAYWAAWYDRNSGGETHPVGNKLPNAFGLFDMRGNVWEWCQDGYQYTYAGAPTDGSVRLSAVALKYRVIRGGSEHDHVASMRSTVRDGGSPDVGVANIGLRVVAVVRK